MPLPCGRTLHTILPFPICMYLHFQLIIITSRSPHDTLADLQSEVACVYKMTLLALLLDEEVIDSKQEPMWDRCPLHARNLVQYLSHLSFLRQLALSLPLSV